MQRFAVIESTEFALYERILREGQDAVRPVPEQLRDFGFNTARIFLMNVSVHHLLPWEWPNFFSDLPACAHLLYEHGIYPDFVLGTQWQTLMPNPADQRNYVQQCWAALYDCPGMVSLVNENDQHDNRVADETLALDPPRGAKFLYSRGSNGSDSDTVTPVAQIGEYHIIGSEYQRKVGHNAMELADWHGIPIWTSEAQRSDNDGYNEIHAYDAGAGSGLLNAGGCAHTPEGKQGQLMTASAGWAKAFAAGVRSVPLEFQAGRYNRIDNPDYLRVYQRILPDGRAWTVNIHY